MDYTKQNEETLCGTVSAIIFQNEENGYTVCEVEFSDGDGITVTGTLPYLNEGDKITVRGVFVNHPVYGPQFKASSFEKSLPTEQGDILRYLSTGNIKGIGPRTAARIVEKFGTDTFDVLANHPDWLADIPGISLKKAASICESFAEAAGVRAVVLFCQNYFTPAAALKIYKQWGVSSVDRLKENPYLLCRDIEGIGFTAADKLANSLGFPSNSPLRIAAGISHILQSEAQKSGHTCLPTEQIVSLAVEGLAVPREMVEATLASMRAEKALYATSRGDEAFLALPMYHRAEAYIAKKLSLLSRYCVRPVGEDTERLIWQAEAENHMEYAALQKQAIRCALGEGVTILTGGPGTGKTTVIRALIDLFESLGFHCALAAPTGRAAKRMSEATCREAKTVHRLLEMEYSGEERMRFGRDEKNVLEEDVVILDECSMVDVLLLESLLRAMKNGSRLVLIGDARQLPSVGAGNVLGDLIESGAFPTICLTEIFRQAQRSLIVKNSHAINEGRMPDITDKKGDFFFLTRDTDESVAATVVDLVKNRLPRSYGENIVESIQIITPSHSGAAGTAQLNRLLQGALNPPAPQKAERTVRDSVFRVGDRVMQVKNNYTLPWTKNGKEGMGIFNGDIGVILDIDFASESLLVSFDQRQTIYAFSELDELEHAYAITVHKSQGSEYPVVILPIFRCPPMLRTRNLLYTAVTRAEKMVILVGRSDLLLEMVENDRHAVRCTNLLVFLKEDLDP